MPIYHAKRSFPGGSPTRTNRNNIDPPGSPITDLSIATQLINPQPTNTTNDLSNAKHLFDATQFMGEVNRTIEHQHAILKCRKAPFVKPGLAQAPVWTPHKAWLSEALDYVGKHVGKGCRTRGETLSSELDSVVSSFNLRGEVVVSIALGPGGDENLDGGGAPAPDEDEEEEEIDQDEDGGGCGDEEQVDRSRAWLDGEIVLCEVAVGARSASERSRVLGAWNQTWLKETPVIVIVGRKWGEAERIIPWPAVQARWVVLDHFRVAEFWMDKRGSGPSARVVGMVKLQKADLDRESWWMAGRQGVPPVMPLKKRRFWGDMWDETKKKKCPTCDETSPTVYRECWLCLNGGCRNFWSEGMLLIEDGGTLLADGTEKLTLNADFLMARTVFDHQLKPSWDLVPDLKRGLEAWKTANTVMGTARMRSLWRGMVCDICCSIVPKRQWCRWECENDECHQRTGKPWYFIFDMGQIPLQAVVPRAFVSWSGHSLQEPLWADEFKGSAKRMYRPTYTVDTWSDGDSVIKIISPTAEFNERQGGPNQLFRSLLRDANQQEGSLGLTRSNRHPKLDGYFHKTFGVEYGISSGQRKSHTKARPLDSNSNVAQAQVLLNSICHQELAGYRPEAANSVQVHGYMEGMSLDWHRDGEGDLGPTIATLSLGGDAELVVRAKISDDDDEEAVPLPLIEEERRMRGRTRVRLIHGSVVLMHGSFDRHFEHKVECNDPLRFAVTARFVNRDVRAHMVFDSRNGDRRFNGQAFVENEKDSEGDSNTPPAKTLRPMATDSRPSTKKRQRPEDISAQASPVRPAQRLKRRLSPKEYKDAGWTQNEKDCMYQWKGEGSTYKQIAERAEKEFKLSGRVNPDNLRMVINREKTRRKKRAELLGEDDVSSLGPSDSASMMGPNGEVTGDSKTWTQPEIERLVEYRSRDPPVPYKDIREAEGEKRTEKAYREQMNTQNRKTKGLPRSTGDVGAAAQQHPRPLASGRHGPLLLAAAASRQSSPLARSSGDEEQRQEEQEEREEDGDVDMDQIVDEEPPLPAPPRPNAETRSSRASRSRASRGSRTRTAGADGRQGSGDGMQGVVMGSGLDGLEGPAARTRTRSRANIADDS